MCRDVFNETDSVCTDLNENEDMLDNVTVYFNNYLMVRIVKEFL
jgi:hypothetical protein